ncbi:DUF881 domain-containing protein [Actinoplanes sp. NPDC048988]|uniref:DUF881 domain-containing protein n=1 Tax=Actinoplanes sp. NPDC048988 TaxID=3363901 RepID=UPI00371095CB
MSDMVAAESAQQRQTEEPGASHPSHDHVDEPQAGAEWVDAHTSGDLASAGLTDAHVSGGQASAGHAGDSQWSAERVDAHVSGGQASAGQAGDPRWSAELTDAHASGDQVSDVRPDAVQWQAEHTDAGHAGGEHAGAAHTGAWQMGGEQASALPAGEQWAGGEWFGEQPAGERKSGEHLDRVEAGRGQWDAEQASADQVGEAEAGAEQGAGAPAAGVHVDAVAGAHASTGKISGRHAGAAANSGAADAEHAGATASNDVADAEYVVAAASDDVAEAQHAGAAASNDVAEAQRAGAGAGGDAAGGEQAGEAGSGAAPKRVYAPDFLTELFRNPLDPGYADAAARKARDGEPTGVRKAFSSGLLVVTLIALGFLLVVAYQQTVADEPARTTARAELVEQVQKRREETSHLQDRAEALSDEVAGLRERELSSTTVQRLRNLEAATGLAQVTGSGARITVADGPTPINPVTGERNTVARVKDSDLQLATNALWSLGAEAIAINGQRLTATSTIRQAGEAILVDFRPVTSPYEVVAIGPDDLAKDFREGYAGKFFEQLGAKYGMSFQSKEVDDVTLPAATELKLRVAQPSTPPPTPSGSLPPLPSSATPDVSSSSEGGR